MDAITSVAAVLHGSSSLSSSFYSAADAAVTAVVVITIADAAAKRKATQGSGQIPRLFSFKTKSQRKSKKVLDFY